ncbi:MAG: DNA gyrase inhibitor YacG [Pseudomonadota bacterium]
MPDPAPHPAIAKRRKACPICGRPASASYRPFCSARCKDADLMNWLRGAYRIPTEEPPAEDEDDAGPEGKG